ncbi:MAG: L,D-transpeptidase family protein [Pseudomonadota bacterium]
MFYRFLGSRLPSLCAAFALTLALAITVATPADAAKKKRSAKPSQPVTLVVDLRSQRVRAYAGVKQIWSSRISSGKRGHRTPTGVFSIIQKRSRHFSNLYNNAPMPHMQRLTWSGIAFHGGPIPGYPASHGCVRLPYGKARQLFRMTRMSTRTIVTYASPRPSVISHAKLWNKLPEVEPDQDPTAKSGPVASNDNDTERDVTATSIRETSATVVNRVLGVSEAQASTTNTSLTRVHRADRFARTQAEVRARQELELKTAENALALAMTRARIGKAVVDAHTKDLVDVNKSRRLAVRELAKAKRVARRATRAKARAEQRLKSLLVRNVSADVESAAYDRLEQRETDIEARLAKATADWEVASSIEAELKTAIDRLADRRVDLMDKLKPARLEHRRLGREALAAKQARDRIESAIELHDRPVHVLISRTKSKIYMRQGYKDVYEADIEVRDADKPIGTHVLTVIDEADDGESLRWSATTVPDAKYGGRSKSRKRRNRKARVKAAPQPRLTARLALDRVVLPPEAEQRLREVLKRGSSVIISDRGPSHETGKGTDFVVLTR